MIYNLFAGGVQVGNQVCSVLLLLQSCEHHLSAGDVLLGVDQVLVQGVVPPGDALVNVGLGVAEPSCLTSLATNHTIQVWALLVFSSSLDCVTLSTGLGEDLLAVISAHVRSEIESNVQLLVSRMRMMQ